MAADLTWEHKVYIVRAFATLRTVEDILDTLQMHFGLRCKPDDILPFDASYRTLPPDLYQIHLQACKDYEDHPEKMVPLLSPIKQETVLANAAQRCLRHGETGIAAKLLEQLAKMQGGFFAAKAPLGKVAAAADAVPVQRITRTIVDPTPPALVEQDAE